MGRLRLAALCCATLLLPACSSSSSNGDAGGNPDSGPANDAGTDAGSDAGACLDFTVTASQSPGAFLVVLSRSGAMSQQNAWANATQGVVQALDTGGFDGLSLGLELYPSGTVPAPACLGGIVPTVACGVPTGPQIPLADAGTDRSSATSGVRHDIATLLTLQQPDNSGSDTSPAYDALSGGYQALADAGQLLPFDAGVPRLALAAILNGGFSCTSVSAPVRPGYSDGTCPDWEEPPIVDTLVGGQQQLGPQSFFIGLPGSNSQGGMNGIYSTAPYSMQLALSTYAVMGSPNTVPATCNQALTFSQAGPPPAAPCHFDLSGPDAGSPSGVQAAVQAARERAFGCLYAVPAPPPGKSIQPGLVNVVLHTDGNTTSLTRRASTANTCTTAPGCWDYDSLGRISLLGAACDALSAAGAVQVQLAVGCPTVTR